MNNKVAPTSSAIIDLRTPQMFERGHLAGALNISFEKMKQSLFLLPDRHVPLTIVAESALRNDLTEFLQSKGYRIERCLEEKELLSESTNRSANIETGRTHSRLWRPCPTVAQLDESFEISGKRVLDLGCGAGRDAVYLASKGAKVTAVDYIIDMSARVSALAASESVEVDFVCDDLEHSSSIVQQRAVNEWQGAFDLIVVVRYLHRPLFDTIRQLLAKDGLLVWHTFMTGCEAFGSPKNPNFLLRENELSATFSDFETIVDKKIFLADGRPVNSFIARKTE